MLFLEILFHKSCLVNLVDIIPARYFVPNLFSGIILSSGFAQQTGYKIEIVDIIKLQYETVNYVRKGKCLQPEFRDQNS